MTLDRPGPRDVDIAEVTTATIKKVITCLHTNKWPKNADIKPFFPLRASLSMKNNILIKHHQISSYTIYA